MNKFRSCLSFAVLTIMVVLLGAVAVIILRGASKVNIEGSMPPTVIVNSPTAGESITAGSFLLANVTSTGQNPIARIELWLDGTLLETQIPGVELGEVTTFYATANIPMTEGSHMFSARAVDSKGLIGQSLPVTVQGKPRSSQNGGDPSQPQSPSGNTPSQPSSPGQPPPGGAPSQPPIAILPPAPLPVTPPGVTISSVLEYKPVDISSLFPILLSMRPKAPTSLQAGFENCKIRLVWVDNDSSETYFNVWMQALGGPPKVIATLKGTSQTGPAWYEFASPSFGIYSFWIEAVNGLGGQSSEIAWVGVNDTTCGPGVATHLKIEVLDMYIPGGYDRAYCYLSIENTPEKRFPVTDGTYFQVLGGWGDVSNWTGSGNKILAPIPTDNEITLDSKCLGRQGASQPSTLGIFNTSAPKETWDGRRLEIKGPGYTIGYRIQPHGPSQVTVGSFKYTDYTIPTPANLAVVVKTSPNQSTNAALARLPALQWTWSGDAKKLNLTGFTLLMDGKPLQGVNQVPIGSGKWEDTFFLPTSCGGTYKFQVVANSGEAQSVPSAVYEHKQPLCEIYAEVKFVSVTFTALDDGELGSCDTVEAYYSIGVNGKGRQFGEFEGDDIKMDCGEFYFSRLPALMPQEHKYESVDTFIVPISAQNLSANVVDIWASFTDNDDILFDDADSLCFASVNLNKSSQAWVNLTYPENIKLPCPVGDNYDARGFVTVSVRGFIAPAGSP